jgi:L-ribulokinase
MAGAVARRREPRAAVARAYSIGIDFGTESGRVLLLDLSSGVEAGVAVVPYARGVIDRALPGTDEPLASDWALQDPDDWRRVVDDGVPAALAAAGVDGRDVVGIGIDFTCCTVLPVAADSTPLCELPTWRSRPHAWPKLWKHHAAQHVADRLNEVALARDEPFLERYGGRISSEWYFPKLIELWLEDRAVYDAADRFVEACDWIVWYLTGRLRRAECSAGYKALWSRNDGLPSVAFFTEAYPGFESPSEKLGTEFAALGEKAGTLRPELAHRIGLRPDVAVAVGNVDSFVSAAGAGIREATSFLTVIGTSICDVVVHPDEILLPGVTGVVKDGVLPGLYGYEAGQAAVGDMLAWFVGLFSDSGIGYAELERRAGLLTPGASGLMALDWWNGNRSVLSDADLSGVMIGMRLQTTPPEMYRALLESIAFGGRTIIDNFEAHGLPLEQLVACGGIAEKSPLTMQLLANICGRRVLVPASTEIPARGSALFGAVAARPEVGGFHDIMAAIDALAPGIAATYEPDPDAVATYEDLYALYRELHDTLGREHIDLLHTLKRTRERTVSRSHDRETVRL